MSKRNLILIIIAIVALVSIAGYLIFSRSSTTTPDTQAGVDSTGFPISGNNPLNGLVDREDTNATSTNGGGTPAKLLGGVKNVSEKPAVNGMFFKKNNQVTVKYLQRDNGNIYEHDVRSGNAIRVSNTTIPLLQETLWSNPNRGILRYLENGVQTIQSYSFSLGTTSSTTPEQKLTGITLPEDISSMTLSPNKTRMFYLLAEGQGVIGTLANVDGTKASIAFRSPLKEWQPQWATDTLITLTSNASSQVPGYLYFLNPSTGATQLILSGIRGLTTLTSPSGTSVLYFDAADNSLNIFDTKKNASVKVSLATLPEKCVWSAKSTRIYCAAPGSALTGELPDAWYQGIRSFADTIWEIDPATGVATIVSGLRSIHGGSIDAINLVLSPDEDYLLLSNKKDYTLWTVTLPRSIN
jgi:hypothetical protein